MLVAAEGDAGEGEKEAAVEKGLIGDGAEEDGASPAEEEDIIASELLGGANEGAYGLGVVENDGAERPEAVCPVEVNEEADAW